MSKEETSREKNETETVSVEAKTEEEKLTEYATAGLRGPRFGIREQLIAQSLVQSTVATDPLRKTQHICEVGLMVEEEKRRALNIDMGKLEVVRAVNEAFIHRAEIRNKEYDCLVIVEFGFEETEKNYDRYIKPWEANARVRHYPSQLARNYGDLGRSSRLFHCRNCRNLVSDDSKGNFGITSTHVCKYCGANLKVDFREPYPFIMGLDFKWHDSTPQWRRFFAFCGALSEAGYVVLKNHFLKWSMPFTMQLTNKLTKTVRPEIYNQIAEMFLKVRKETKSD